MQPVGKPDAGNRHVRFDERGWETGRLYQRAPAPILDSTCEPVSQNSAKAKRRLESRRGTQECVRYTLFANISCFLRKCNLLSYDIALGKVLGVHSMLE